MTEDARIERGPRADRTVTERTEVIPVAIDRHGVHWGSVWAGLLTAISLFVLFSMLAASIGLATFEPGATGEAAVLQTGGIAGGIVALITFLLGGMVAGRSAGPGPGGYPMLHGFLVWALGLVLILVFAAFGLGQLFGVPGGAFAQFQQIGTGAIEQAQLEQVRAGALGAFIGALLMALAATLGGWLGALTRPHPEAA